MEFQNSKIEMKQIKSGNMEKNEIIEDAIKKKCFKCDEEFQSDEEEEDEFYEDLCYACKKEVKRLEKFETCKDCDYIKECKPLCCTLFFSANVFHPTKKENKK